MLRECVIFAICLSAEFLSQNSAHTPREWTTRFKCVWSATTKISIFLREIAKYKKINCNLSKLILKARLFSIQISSKLPKKDRLMPHTKRIGTEDHPAWFTTNSSKNQRNNENLIKITFDLYLFSKFTKKSMMIYLKINRYFYK